MTDETEHKIAELFVRADALRKLYKLEEEYAEVTVMRYADVWTIKVSPSVVRFEQCNSNLVVKRNYTSKSLGVALEKAMDGTNKELQIARSGKVNVI